VTTGTLEWCMSGVLELGILVSFLEGKSRFAWVCMYVIQLPTGNWAARRQPGAHRRRPATQQRGASVSVF
jgi:hypothetical protein